MRKNDAREIKLLFTKFDLIIIIIMIILGGILSFFIFSKSIIPDNSNKSLELVVLKDNHEIKRYSLENDIIESIGENGIGQGKIQNKFQIKDGKVSMIQADCNDNTCIKMGTILRENETIVCLPHKLVLKIVSKKGNENKEEKIDAVSK